ncbi:MAG: glycosyltransferase [Flavobacterium sp.]
MKETPLVTVICLCYNQEKYVVEALNSVINQSYKNIEILVLDDCSDDNSAAVIQNWLLNYPKVQFISNNQNVGNTKSFNQAAKFATGDYLIDLATDDILNPNCIALQIDAFQKSTHSNLGMVYGNAENIHENGSFDSYYFHVDGDQKVISKRPTGNIYTSILAGGNCMCSVSAMIKKEVFDRLQGFDENLYYEDLDFWIRVARSYNFDFIDAVLVKKRKLSNSLGAQFFERKEISKNINSTTYQILKKAFKLNKTKEENKALLKRVHFEIELNLKNKNFSLLLKLLVLKLKINLKILF